MNTRTLVVALGAVFTLATAARAASAGPSFYGDPPDKIHPWGVHDPNRPQPKIVKPGTFSSQEKPGVPPSDAVILFDGTSLDSWVSQGKGGPAKWLVTNGYMQVVPGTGDIRTKEEFGDCQLHIEWAAPKEIKGSGQGRGNSGIFLLGLIEIQVLDVYDNPTYADGQAGSIYGVNPPMVNAVNPPGEFQFYDILFRRPIYKDGQVLDPGRITVLVNGVVVQEGSVPEGGTGHMGRTKIGPLPEKGPIKLQDHTNPMRFRNIWYRPLPPRPIQGGTDGALTPEAAMAKRQLIAADIRADAAKLKNAANPVPEMLRLLESIVYENEPATYQKVEQMAKDYVAGLKQLPADKVAAKKDEAKNVNSAFKYMARFKLVPDTFTPKADLDAFIKEKQWDKK